MEITISIYDKKQRPGDFLLLTLMYLCAIITVSLFAGIVIFVFYRGISKVNWQFITGTFSALKGTYGIAGNIINTLYIVVLTLLMATPIGIGAAIYLNEYAKPGRLVRLIEFTTETLSGIPSIIFGLFGMVFFGNTLGLSYSLLTGAFTLSLMVLPLITRNTQEALKAVPKSYRDGALGMGSTKWHMIKSILIPSAMPGIITGVILSIGRIVGESAALLFTAGSASLLPKLGEHKEGLVTKVLEPGGTLTIELYLSMSKAEYDHAFGIAVVLLVIVFLVNILTKVLARRFDVTRRK